MNESTVHIEGSPPATAPGSRTRVWIRAYALASLLAAGACSDGSIGPGATTLSEGTWGGDDAGLVLDETTAHVHFGCTYGDFPAPVQLDDGGRFSVSGAYHLHVYPVAVGPAMPAELAGVVSGRELTMTAAVNDTIEGRLVIFGPTTVRLGREPEMQICPICETPRRAGKRAPELGTTGPMSLLRRLFQRPHPQT